MLRCASVRDPQSPALSILDTLLLNLRIVSQPKVGTWWYITVLCHENCPTKWNHDIADLSFNTWIPSPPHAYKSHIKCVNTAFQTPNSNLSVIYPPLVFHADPCRSALFRADLHYSAQICTIPCRSALFHVESVLFRIILHGFHMAQSFTCLHRTLSSTNH